MNRNLNLKIKESIETKQLSENLFLLCLACLYEKITYSEHATTRLEKQRNIIAKAALKYGVTKEDISEKIVAISKQDYPTFKQVAKVSDIIEKCDYIFASGLIPIKGHIHFKTDEELKADLARKPVKEKIDTVSKELQEIVNYVRQEYGFDDSMEKAIYGQIQKAKTARFTYPLILQTFKLYNSDIKKSISNKIQNEGTFKDSFSKLSYIFGIVKRKKNDTMEYMKKINQQEESFWMDNANVILSGDETLYSPMIKFSKILYKMSR